MSNPITDQIASGFQVASGGSLGQASMGAPGIPIDVASNLMSMIHQIRDKMVAQDDTNRMLINAVFKIQRDMSTLQPDPFGLHQNAPSGGIQPAQNNLTSSQAFQTTSTGLAGSFNQNVLNHNIPNIFNYAATNPFAGSPLERKMHELTELIMNIPGVDLPIHQASPTCFNESRFVPAIANIDIPKRFMVPTMKQYDGTTDPLEHVALYQEKMNIVHIPLPYKEACFCRGFGTTLTGAALRWLINQPIGSIESYAQLVNLFVNQFSCNKVFDKLTSDLYRITQQPDETLKEYLRRFNTEAIDVTNLDMSTAVEAFKMGLDRTSMFYEDLVMNPCKKLDDVRNRATKFIRLEEDELMWES